MPTFAAHTVSIRFLPLRFQPLLFQPLCLQPLRFQPFALNACRCPGLLCMSPAQLTINYKGALAVLHIDAATVAQVGGCSSAYIFIFTIHHQPQWRPRYAAQ